jgi:hypothetical protein
MAARDEANRIRAKVTPADWARMTHTQKKARLAKEARS